MEIEKKVLWLNKQFKSIVLTILKPLFYLYQIVTPDYKTSSRLFSVKDKYYCGSDRSYTYCHKIEHKRKGLRARMIKKENIKTGRLKIKIVIETDTSRIKSRFKKGAINPLNKRGNFVDTGNYGL